MNKRLSTPLDFANHDHVLVVPRMIAISDFANYRAMGIGLLPSIMANKITKGWATSSSNRGQKSANTTATFNVMNGLVDF